MDQGFTPRLKVVFFGILSVTLLMMGCCKSTTQDGIKGTSAALSDETATEQQANSGTAQVDTFGLQENIATFSIGPVSNFPLLTSFIASSSNDSIKIKVENLPWPTPEHDSITSVKGYLVDAAGSRHMIFNFGFFPSGGHSSEAGEIPVAAINYEITSQLQQARAILNQNGLGADLTLALEILGNNPSDEDLQSYYETLKLVFPVVTFH